jgi:hypothetical protein
VSRLVDPRLSVIPALVVFGLGLVLFLVDSTLNPRPGPVLYLLTPTPVALGLYVRLRPTTGQPRLLGLAVWGFAGTTAAGLLTILVAIGTRLPRPYEAWEFFLLDLGVFLWFVLALSGAFVVAARTQGWRSRAALAAGPVAQFGGFLLTVMFTAEDVVLGAVAF